jgi:hypothetical protein
MHYIPGFFNKPRKEIDMIHLIEPHDEATYDAEVLPPMQVRQPATRNPMLLHCGGAVVERDALFAVQTPSPTSTWFPLPHRHLVEEVETQLTDAGFAVLGESHALSHDGDRYFGVLEIAAPQLRINAQPNQPNGHGWVVGLRNSHDKRFPAGLVAGTKVFVCDNLSFSGLIQIRRKHTRFAARDLRQLTARAVGQLGDRLAGMELRIAAYQELRLDDRRAHDLVIRATDCRAITPSQIPGVLGHWRDPAHDAFRPRNGWSLWNAFTEVYKEANPHTAIARCEALHGLFDGASGVAHTS